MKAQGNDLLYHSMLEQLVPLQYQEIHSVMAIVATCSGYQQLIKFTMQWASLRLLAIH